MFKIICLSAIGSSLVLASKPVYGFTKNFSSQSESLQLTSSTLSLASLITQNNNDNSDSLTNLEKEIVIQINKVRKDPLSYAQWLEKQKKYYQGLYLRLPERQAILTKEGVKALEEAIAVLSETNPLPPLQSPPELIKTVKEYVEQTKVVDLIDQPTTTREKLKEIGENNGIYSGNFSQNIVQNYDQADIIVMQLIIDDGVKTRSNRRQILSPEFESVGVGCRQNSVYGTVCAIAHYNNDTNSVVIEPNSSDSNDEQKTENTETEEEKTSLIDPQNPPRTEHNTNTTSSGEEEKSDLTTATAPRNVLLREGILEDGDTTIASDGSLYDSYSLEGKAGESFIVSVESKEFDTFLAVSDADGNIIEQNDDMDDKNSNSRLRLVLPKDGTYQIIINSYDKEGRGKYTLTVNK